MNASTALHALHAFVSTATAAAATTTAAARVAAAAVAATLVVSLPAQSTKVLPSQNATVEGASAVAHPFGYTTSRSQQIWSGSAVSSSVGLINGFHYRRDYGSGSNTAEPGRTYTNATVAIGTTTVAPGQMSATFAANITSPLTKVLNGATLSLPPLPASTSKPEAFQIGLSWTAPYIFDSSQGHLILELDLPGTIGKSNYIVDGQEVPATGSGTFSSFGTGGAFAKPEIYRMDSDASALVPGGAAVFTCGDFSQAYPGTLILGLSDATWGGTPLPLGLGIIGAPNNNLYVSMDFAVPFGASGSGASHQSAFKTTIPPGPAYAGVTFFGQAYYLDANANGAGLVATEALKLTTAKAGAGPITNMIGHYDTTQATGAFQFGNGRFGGPVIRLSGVF